MPELVSTLGGVSYFSQEYVFECATVEEKSELLEAMRKALKVSQPTIVK